MASPKTHAVDASGRRPPRPHEGRGLERNCDGDENEVDVAVAADNLDTASVTSDILPEGQDEQAGCLLS